MKKTTTILTVIIITLISFSSIFAQYSESFENSFYPSGWSGKGFEKSNAKKKSGNYSAISSKNSTNGEENYMVIENVTTSSNATISFSCIAHNGNKGTQISVFIKNSSISKGDSVLVTSVTPSKGTWSVTSLNIPNEYQNTEDNKIYFIVKKTGNGNDKVYIDDVNSNFPMPVEMSSFTYNVNKNNVNLKWNTTSEINNKGFEVQRNSGNEWIVLGFVSASSTKSYNFIDNSLNTGSYQYRLKQIDFNGNFEYFTLNSDVKVGSPAKFSLSQNYPNPFNPSTKINFQIPTDEFVTLKVFDNAGREVLSLVNEIKAAGYHTVEMKTNLTSGVYYYVLVAGSHTDTKKMTVIK